MPPGLLAGRLRRPLACGTTQKPRKKYGFYLNLPAYNLAMASAEERLVRAAEILRNVHVRGLFTDSIRKVKGVNRQQLRAIEMMGEVTHEHKHLGWPRGYDEFCTEVAKRLVQQQNATPRFETVEVFVGLLRLVDTLGGDSVGSVAFTLRVIAIEMYDIAYRRK